MAVYAGRALTGQAGRPTTCETCALTPPFFPVARAGRLTLATLGSRDDEIVFGSAPPGARGAATGQPIAARRPTTWRSSGSLPVPSSRSCSDPRDRWGGTAATIHGWEKVQRGWPARVSRRIADLDALRGCHEPASIAHRRLQKIFSQLSPNLHDTALWCAHQSFPFMPQAYCHERHPAPQPGTYSVSPVPSHDARGAGQP
jgi:hypothetical protein